MLNKINAFSTKRLQLHGHQAKAFALFSILNYPISFIILHYFGTDNENLSLRLFIVLLNIPLLSVKSWPLTVKKYLPIYWHFVLLVSIPFFATFLLFESRLSLEWLMNISLGLFWFILLVDWLSFIVLLFIGSCLGFIAFLLLGSSNLSELNIQDSSLLFLAFYMYVYAIILGLIFSRNRMLAEQSYQNILKAAAGAIAHEMRTPLASVSMNGHVLKRSVKQIQHYLTRTQKDKDFADKNLSPLNQMADSLLSVSKHSNNLINVLLTNLKEEMETLPQSDISMNNVLQETLKEFAYRPHEKEKVHISIESDFSFKGNQEIVTHVFYNLLKNSLYFIHACGKGEVFITLKQGRKGNMVLFKDTGPGVEQKRLPKLFTPFYSRRPHGTGIGLAFCKRAIESMGGTIKVDSILNDHTTFTIILPYGNDI